MLFQWHPPFFLPTIGGMNRIVDLTSEQKNPPVINPPTPQKHRIERGKVVVRDPKEIDGIAIHQTAVNFGASPAAIRAAGGDVTKAIHRRALNVGAHMTAFRTGYAVLANPLRWYVNNANTLNRRILGYEIEGSYPGLTKGRTKLHTPFSGEIVEATKAGLKYLVDAGRADGMPIRYIWAHRQSSDTRRGDPGEEIWREIVLEYAVKVLGLETKVGDVFGDGRSIPADWDPRGVGRF